MLRIQCGNPAAHLPVTHRYSRQSNAFAISEAGAAGYIIDDAKSIWRPRMSPLRILLTSLESSRLTIEKEQAEINAYKG